MQYNFVGRLLGPRGNSLKRVEASTDCRILIRGRGSIKDPAKVISSLILILEHWLPRSMVKKVSVNSAMARAW